MLEVHFAPGINSIMIAFVGKKDSRKPAGVQNSSLNRTWVCNSREFWTSRTWIALL